MTAWILVANGGVARIFSSNSVKEFNEVEAFTNPFNRLHEGDLVTDRNGMGKNGSGSHTETYEQPSAKKHEQEKFAGELSDRLDKAFNQQEFQSLHLICSPAFLGLLRQKLSTNVGNTVKTEVQKNLVTHSVSEIRAQLPKML
ncbi:host attachment protein [Hahella ganghwensis]|uniref:host attachment protein n=1 Tax=Hahella ganghwensis TaxID=286420 RepID=UPI00035EC06A|nr:host attachment protein [Hahella ganghwensis]